jgi:GlcNAc-P-P-Und epimerase
MQIQFKKTEMKTAIITGGSGFVGRHLIRYLLEQGAYERVVNIDIQPPSEGFYGLERVEFIQHDLRKPMDKDIANTLSGAEAVIYNLAAICRIPGFPDHDYFETNIRCAEHAVALAEAIGCKNIVFTSSVAPYGASEELKTEESVPMPDNPYGSSKLSAEYIHRLWQQGDPNQRKLTILRPGIIFGKNEQANFTRLYNSLKKGYFFYPGRKDTRKACVYVKDVARACLHFARNGDTPSSSTTWSTSRLPRSRRSARH